MRKKLYSIALFVLLNIIFLGKENLYAADYTEFTHVSGNDYNIHGNLSGQDIMTTYSDAGYGTLFRVNDGGPYDVTNGSGSGGNVTCTSSGSQVSGGNYIKVNFHLKNNGSSTVSVDLASHADIEIGSNDNAPISKIQSDPTRGFTMSDGSGHVFNFLCRKTYGVTDVTSFWFGPYGSRSSHYWDASDVTTNDLTSTDSGMTFCWLDKEIQAGGELDLSVLFGVGVLNDPPTLTVDSDIKDRYYLDEEEDIHGKLNDKNVGDQVTVMYALDGGEEQTTEGIYQPDGVEQTFDTRFTFPEGTKPGKHKIQIWARDDKGNMSAPYTVEVTLIGKLTISGLDAVDREYDKTKDVQLSGGTLQGVVEGTTVTATIPPTGTSASERVGTHAVTIPEITLSGADAQYYELTQPSDIDVIISPKKITITGVDAVDRVYNKSNVVDLTGGELQGVIEGDDVSFTLSPTGTSASERVGTHDVTIPEITLSGADAENYELQQLTEADVDVVISKKHITITGVDAVDRVYNKSKVVDLTGGTLQGVESGDDVSFNLSATGTSASERVGTHDVTIPEITLSGADAENYELEQLSETDVDVIISKKTITITGVDAVDRVYNKSNVVDITGGALQGVESGDDVSFTLPQTGLSESEKVGTHQVMIDEIVLTGNDAENYTLTQLQKEDIDVIISKKKITITGVDAVDREYNKSKDVQLKGGTLQGVEEGDTVNFELSATGTSDSEKVGTHNVTVPEITLNGADATNYELEQPQHTDVDVIISKKHITITGVDARDREYDKTDVVELFGGELQGIEDGDTVTFTLSPTGTSDSEKVGTHNVTVPEITLGGADASNYELEQPQHTDVDVVISGMHINITGIDAVDREYNKTNIVEIFGGELQGVKEGDTVTFVLPQTGTTDNDDVGTYYVNISEITLTGEDASNYTLVQPQKEDVDVIISKKHITITDIDARDREYDKTTIVELFGGELQGVESGDDIGFNLPQTGTIENDDVGTYYVSIDEITLTGDEAKNYELTQPGETDVDVEISRRKVSVDDLDAVDRKYDKTRDVELKGSNLDRKIEGDDVRAKVPEKGLSDNADIGEWDVTLEDIELEGADASNYEIVQPEKGFVKVKITKPDQPEMSVSGIYVSEINGEVWPPVVEEEDEVLPEEENNDEPTTDEEVEPEPEVPEVVLPEVRLGDIVKVKVDIVNNGVGAGYIEKIKMNIPEGLEYIEEDETNTQYEWTKVDNGLIARIIDAVSGNEENEEEETVNKETYETTIYSFANGVSNELTTTQTRSVELVFKVTQEEMIEDNLFVETEVEQKDIRNEAIPYNTEVNKSETELYMAYTDFVADLSVKEIVNDATGEKVDFKEEEDFIYFEMPEADVESTLLRVVYNVNVKNDGKSLGETDKVYGYLPEDVEFPQEENENWTVVPNTNMVYNENYSGIEGYSSENQELVVYWNTANGNTIGKEANMLILATDDIDQRKIQEVPYETVDLEDADVKEIEKTNNVDDAQIADIFIDVYTSDIPVVPIAIVFGISLVGIVAIIVVKSRQKNN